MHLSSITSFPCKISSFVYYLIFFITTTSDVHPKSYNFTLKQIFWKTLQQNQQFHLSAIALPRKQIYTINELKLSYRLFCLFRWVDHPQHFLSLTDYTFMNSEISLLSVHLPTKISVVQGIISTFIASTYSNINCVPE